MAILPNVDISTRRVDTAPNLHYYQSHAGEDMRTIGGTITGVANGLDRINEVNERNRVRLAAEQERAERAHKASVSRDGEYAANKILESVSRKADGYVETDPVTGEMKEVKGYYATPWDVMQSEKTSLPILTERAFKDAMEEVPEYRDATPEVRADIDRKLSRYKQDRIAHAFVAQEKLAQSVGRAKMQSNIAFKYNDAAKTYGSRLRVTDPRSGVKMSEPELASMQNAVQTFVMKEGSEIANADEIINNPDARFTDIKWSRELTDEERAQKADAYQDEVLNYHVARINALQRHGECGNAFGSFDPKGCLDEADRLVDGLAGIMRERRGTDGREVPLITSEQALSMHGAIAKSRKLLKGVTAAKQKDNALELAKDMRGRMEGLDDTREALKKRATMETAEDYDKTIDKMIATDGIDAKTGEEYKASYRALLGRLDDLGEKASSGQGVWTQRKTADGKLIDVFLPFQDGTPNGKTAQEMEAKYRGPTAERERMWIDPKRVLDELDYDYKMGKIGLDFFDAEQAKARVMLNPKAKEAYIRVFGVDNWMDAKTTALAPDNMFDKKGNAKRAPSIWAKNRNWKGARDNAPDWRTDILKDDRDGTETLVTDEQRKAIYDFIVECAENGGDPDTAIREILAPTMDKWIASDLETRLEQKNAFMQSVLDKGIGSMRSWDSRDEKVRQRAFRETNQSGAGYKQVQAGK